MIGFEPFSRGDRAARCWRNPWASETVTIPAEKTIRFTAERIRGHCECCLSRSTRTASQASGSMCRQLRRMTGLTKQKLSLRLSVV
ncbi:HU family DNA-binding protein [Paraburkholderia fungorum]|uniref:HU family DNA-binding protein n=1 Tax=Paraburkholderia fungorum TaxID=134537 RepID=UPI003313B165